VNGFAAGYEQYEVLFLQLCDERRTVNAFELQELLETCLPNGETKSKPNQICK
jgi:hypothetical protein